MKQNLFSTDLSTMYDKGTEVVVYCYESEKDKAEKDKAEKETRKMGYIPIDFVFVDNEYGISHIIPKGHFTCAPKVKIRWDASPYTTIFARMML
jgi:hypothetical protein